MTRPRAVFTSDVLPSKSTQTGVTCGVPSAFSVARLRERWLRGQRDRRVMQESSPSEHLSDRHHSPTIAESRVVDLVTAVDGDRQRGEMLDRPRARQRADIDGPQSRQHAATSADRARARLVRVAADELVAVERRVAVAERCAGTVLNAAASRDVVRQPRADVFGRRASGDLEHGHLPAGERQRHGDVDRPRWRS